MRPLLVALLAFAAISCVCNTPASGANLFWGLDADDDWNNANNWSPDGVIVGPVPGAADLAIIFESTISPLITGAAATGVNMLAPSWIDGQTTALNIGPGGSINVGGDFGGAVSFTRLSGGSNGSSTVNFMPGAGITVWSILQMSFSNANQGGGGFPLPGTESDSFINLDGGILHLGSLGFSNNGSNTTNIDIGTGGTLLVNGDHIAGGNAAFWTSNNYVTADDGAGTVSAIFEPANGWTRFTLQTVDLSADFDNDGDVDSDDIIVWGSDYAVNDFSDADGDFDSDGADFLYWQRTYTGPGPLSPGAAVGVPEPTSLVLLALAGLGCIARRQR